MSKYIERVENLIRVVSNVLDDQFDLSHCRLCALGHAGRDAYFVAQGLQPDFPTIEKIQEFFDITKQRAILLFFWHVGHKSRQDVLRALRVLLLEKMAQEITPEIEVDKQVVDSVASDVKEMELV